MMMDCRWGFVVSTFTTSLLDGFYFSLSVLKLRLVYIPLNCSKKAKIFDNMEAIYGSLGQMFGFKQMYKWI